MPKAPSAETARERAHKRALATLQALPKVDGWMIQPERQVMPTVGDSISPLTDEAGDASAQTREPELTGSLRNYVDEESALPETETVVAAPVEAQPEEPKKRGRGPAKPKEPESEQPQSLKRGVGEGFLEYQARIPANEWVSSVYGNYIYKLLGNGKKKRIEDQPRVQPITMGDLREIAAQHGAGEYYVQFTVKNPSVLSSCFETFTIDDEGKGSIGNNAFSKNDPEGLAYSAKVAADITKEAAREGLAMVREERQERNKQPDMAGMFTAMATMIAAVVPKTDNSPFVAMMDASEKRAEAAERRAEDQRRIDREEADRRDARNREENERREREYERRRQEDREQAKLEREREREYNQMMLKQLENGNQSFDKAANMMTSIFKLKEVVDDTMGGGAKGPWDLAAALGERVIDVAPGIVAAMKGAPPQQVAQHMQAANPQGQQQQQPEGQTFYKLIAELAEYFQRDPDNYRGPFLVETIEERYLAVHAEIVNQPKETVLAAITAYEPFGKAIMDHPIASQFMGKIIDAIKFPDTMDDLFPEDEDEGREVILVDPKGVARNPRQRKLNGSVKNAH